MAEIQDEDQWLYGDDKEDSSTVPDVNGEAKAPEVENEKEPVEEVLDEIVAETTPSESQEKEDGSKDKEDQPEERQPTPPLASEPETEDQEKEPADDDSSSEDELLVTIGKIFKQPDIIQAPAPTHRTAPTTGPKDEDFENIGKINDIPITDYNLAEFEEKPWRKPGADLSDYFNYGFTEETWVRYCERQKTFRLQESGVGLLGLGGGHKPNLSNVNLSIPMDHSNKHGHSNGRTLKTLGDNSEDTHQINTIQVMTAEKRTYSNKVLTGGQFENDFSTPPPFGGFYNRPPPSTPAPFYSGPPPFDNSWTGVPNVPPPGWTPDAAPPPVSATVPLYEEPATQSHPRDREVERDRGRDREVERDRDSERRRSRDRESTRYHRKRSRSRSKTRHKKRSRSRSRSPHRRKHKKNKKDSE